MQEYQVPKKRVEVEVMLARGEPERFQMFLGEFSAHHRGAERPSELMNAAEPFVPLVRAEDGVLQIFNKRSVFFLSVAAVEEGGDDPTEELAVKTETVKIDLANGRSVEGTLRMDMPIQKRRVLDFLNESRRFFPVFRGDHALVVNLDLVERVQIRAPDARSTPPR